jgi:ankyrin repeat protein
MIKAFVDIPEHIFSPSNQPVIPFRSHVSSSSSSGIEGPARQDCLNHYLWTCISESNLEGVLSAFIWGANAVYSPVEEEGRNALHQAVMYSDLSVCLCVFLCALPGPAASNSNNRNINHKRAAGSRNGSRIGGAIGLGNGVATSIEDVGKYHAITAKAVGAMHCIAEERGWTPLHYAAYQDSVSLVLLCLQFAHPRCAIATDSTGLTAEDCARHYNEHSVAGSVLQMLNESVNLANNNNNNNNSADESSSTGTTIGLEQAGDVAEINRLVHIELHQ